AKEFVDFFLSLIGMSCFSMGPPCPRYKSFNFKEVSNDVRLSPPIGSKPDTPLTEKLTVHRLHYAPTSTLGWFMNNSGGSSDLIHLVWANALRRHGNWSPPSQWIIIWVSVYLLTVFVWRQEISCLSEPCSVSSIEQHILMHSSHGWAVVS